MADASYSCMREGDLVRDTKIALESKFGVPRCDLESAIRQHMVSSPKFLEDYANGLSRDKFCQFIAGQITEWAKKYCDRIEFVLISEFRYIPFNINHMMMGLISCTRIRLLNVIIALCTNSNVSECAVISKIPSISNANMAKVTDASNIMEYMEYRRIHYMGIPSRGMNFIGQLVMVPTASGAMKPGFFDYKSRSALPDLIIPGEFPCSYRTTVGGIDYISYFHLDSPHSKAVAPHYRLSAVASHCTINSVTFALPSFMLSVLDYANGSGLCALDALVLPIEALSTIPDYKGYVKYINCILNGVPTHVSSASMLLSYVKLNSNSNQNNYFVTRDTELYFKSFPKDYKDCYTDLVDKAHLITVG